MYASEDQPLIFAHRENSYSKGETSKNIDPKIYQKSFLGAWLPIRGTDRFQTLLWPGDTEGLDPQQDKNDMSIIFGQLVFVYWQLNTYKRYKMCTCESLIRRFHKVQIRDR